MKDCTDTAHREKRLDPVANGFLKCHETSRRQFFLTNNDTNDNNDTSNNNDMSDNDDAR